jgi:hypothetical protein
MRISGSARPIEHYFIHPGSKIVVRLRLHTAPDVLSERRAFMDFQEVKREVFRP